MLLLALTIVSTAAGVVCALATLWGSAYNDGSQGLRPS